MKIVEVGGKRLNPQQNEAATCSEPSCLVLAGAGTGKTTTILGRVKHLISEGADPSSILIISLTNNTVADMKKAISEKLPEASGVTVSTIHGLGLRIVGKKPCVGDERSRIIGRIVYDLAQEDRNFSRDLLAWIEGMRSTVNSDLCYSGHQIQNKGLRELGDALFSSGVGFRYSPLKFTEKGFEQAYVIIDGTDIRVDSDSPNAKEFSKDPVKAINYVASNFPQSRPMNANDLASSVLRAWGNRIPESLGSMISRCKCARKTVAELKKTVGRVPLDDRGSVNQRLDVLEKVWNGYKEYYSEHKMSDFDDMVIESATMVSSGYKPYFSYDHVLVDEYQDSSPVLVDLVKSLRRVWNFDLFCAGDDWQSIYSFTGADVWQIYGFEECWKEWGEVAVRNVERTYRHSQQMADLASNFVKKNPSQRKKTIKATQSSRYPIQLLGIKTDRDIPYMVANRLELIPPDESVFVIGRSRNDLYALCGNSQQFRYAKEQSGTTEVLFLVNDTDLNEYLPHRTFTFLTAHSAKGLEADWVFLLADRERGGFPSRVADPIDVLFENKGEGIEDAEERRVFYVALTRARKGMFLINQADDYVFASGSPFMSELINDNRVSFRRSTPMCPQCEAPMKIQRSSRGIFYGCSRYPACRGSEAIKGKPF